MKMGESSNTAETALSRIPNTQDSLKCGQCDKNGHNRTCHRNLPPKAKTATTLAGPSTKKKISKPSRHVQKGKPLHTNNTNTPITNNPETLHSMAEANSKLLFLFTPDPRIPPKMKLANSTHEATNNTQTTFSLCLAFATDFSSLFHDFRSPGITAFDRSHISGSNHAQNWQPLKPLLFSRTFAAHMENRLPRFEFVQEVRIVAALPHQHIGASSSIPGIQLLLDLLR
ncbi:hypothetical protein ACE6H2_002068 [Prunus campanulata]